MIALACDFMPSFCHLSNNLGYRIGNPSQDEKGSFDLKSIKQIERIQRVLLDALFESVPPFALADPVKRGDVKVVFECDGQYVPLGSRKMWMSHGS